MADQPLPSSHTSVLDVDVEGGGQRSVRVCLSYVTLADGQAMVRKSNKTLTAMYTNATFGDDGEGTCVCTVIDCGSDYILQCHGTPITVCCLGCLLYRMLTQCYVLNPTTFRCR